MGVREAIVLVAGPPGGGKTTVMNRYMDAGPWVRLNRDVLGGSLNKPGSKVYEEVRRLFFDEGKRHFVLDNVYADRNARAVAIDFGAKLGLPVTLKWLQTTKEQAQFLAALRQVRTYDKLLTGPDYKAMPYKKDPGMFPPAAQFAYWKRREEPTADEGFADIEFVPVDIDLGPEYTNAAIIFDYDGTLRTAPEGKKWPTDPSEVALLPGCREKLLQLRGDGFLLLGASNQSGVSRSPGDPKALTDETAVACFDRTHELLGVDLDYLYATERGGVPQSYWRKPCPGMGVVLIEKYKLDPSKCLMVGDRGEDRTFAARCGFNFQLAESFFKSFAQEGA